MQAYPANHPVWKLIRLAVVGAILLGCLAFVYAGLDKRDALTLIATLAGLGGFDMAKAAITKTKTSGDATEEEGDVIQ